MKNEPINLLSNHLQRVYFLLAVVLIFSFNIAYEYRQYDNFKNEEFLKVKGQLLNIYNKDDYDVIKIKTKQYHFFTSVSKESHFNKNDLLSLVILTSKVTFLEYLKGFYAQSILPEKVQDHSKTKQVIVNINEQHENTNLQELFNALFLAIPLNEQLRDFFANLGVSHLIAISGFHLGVLSFCIYGLFYVLYSPLHQRVMPYRNKRFDILIVTMLVLFAYLILTGVVPSLLRAFVMLILGTLLLRSHIKILSFEMLLVTFFIIAALYPRYIFSLSLWFSLCGVFYIFLFLKYFQQLPRMWMFLLFNIWIFAAFNPIVHYFFSNTSLEQLFSPLLTLLFTLFYPIELFAHLLGFGSFLDEYLSVALNYKITMFEVLTPLWFFIGYVCISLFSIIQKEAFILLNLLMIGFNIYLYV